MRYAPSDQSSWVLKTQESKKESLRKKERKKERKKAISFLGYPPLKAFNTTVTLTVT